MILQLLPCPHLPLPGRETDLQPHLTDIQNPATRRGPSPPGGPRPLALPFHVPTCLGPGDSKPHMGHSWSCSGDICPGGSCLGAVHTHLQETQSSCLRTPPSHSPSVARSGPPRRPTECLRSSQACPPPHLDLSSTDSSSCQAPLCQRGSEEGSGSQGRPQSWNAHPGCSLSPPSSPALLLPESTKPATAWVRAQRASRERLFL